jgi:hypothetical protein
VLPHGKMPMNFCFIFLHPRSQKMEEPCSPVPRTEELDYSQ